MYLEICNFSISIISITVMQYFDLFSLFHTNSSEIPDPPVNLKISDLKVYNDFLEVYVTWKLAGSKNENEELKLHFDMVPEYVTIDSNLTGAVFKLRYETSHYLTIRAENCAGRGSTSSTLRIGEHNVIFFPLLFFVFCFFHHYLYQ